MVEMSLRVYSGILAVLYCCVFLSLSLSVSAFFYLLAVSLVVIAVLFITLSIWRILGNLFVHIFIKYTQMYKSVCVCVRARVYTFSVWYFFLSISFDMCVCVCSFHSLFLLYCSLFSTVTRQTTKNVHLIRLPN